MKPLIALLVATVVAPAAAAQELPDEVALEGQGVPRRVAEHVARVFRDPATARWEGARRLEPGETVTGSVAARGGLVVIGGHITGELVVVDGDVEFLPGGSVAGDVTVVNGEVRGVGAESVGGTLTVYGRVADRDDPGSERERVRRRWADALPSPRISVGGARLVARVEPNYNRVEGLPFAFGPQIQTSGSNPLRIEALAIVRTEGNRPLDADQLGYSARAEQFLGGHRELRVGFAARSIVSPIETWQLSDLEASLATLLLHSDQRDYFEREGWAAYARITPRRLALDLTLEYRDEDHTFAAVSDPWTVFGDDPWRAQPFVAEGRLRSLVGEATLDLREGEDAEARSGWYARATLHRGLGGDLRIPSFHWFGPADEPIIVPASPVDENFTAGLLDIRRYNRVGRYASLAFRAVLGGSLTGSALPPQFQHALGGPGSLPGYGPFGADCGARAFRARPAGQSSLQTFFLRYGCDRIALFQAEYRGGLSFNISWGAGHDPDDWDLDWDWDGDLTWSLFFDAARGWALDSDFGREGTGTLYDAGAGILFDDDLGIYAAVPLNGPDRDVKLFLRLGPRF